MSEELPFFLMQIHHCMHLRDMMLTSFRPPFLHLLYKKKRKNGGMLVKLKTLSHTHQHLDHLSALIFLWNITFPEKHTVAKTHMHRQDTNQVTAKTVIKDLCRLSTCMDRNFHMHMQEPFSLACVKCSTCNIRAVGMSE